MLTERNISNLINVTCDACQFRFKVAAIFVGRQGTCPNPDCRHSYIVARPAVNPMTEIVAIIESAGFVDQVASQSTSGRRASARQETATTKTRSPNRQQGISNGKARKAKPKSRTTFANRMNRSGVAPPPPKPGSRERIADGRHIDRKKRLPRLAYSLFAASVRRLRVTWHNLAQSRFASARMLASIGFGVVVVATVIFAVSRPGDPTLQQTIAAEQQKKKSENAVTFESHVAPFVKKYCAECHSMDDPEGGLELSKYKNEAAVLKDRKHWEKVLDFLEDEAMPPADTTQPSVAERQTVVAWIEATLFNLDCEANRDPGRVTMRRLNRVEYDNTIRDLLGIEFQASKDFPSDDVGHGFDNNGDVLSLSPLLMEKYLDAAEKASEAAIVANVDSQAKKARFAGAKLRSKGGNLRGADVWTLSSTGEVFTLIHFPRDGKYILRAEAGADQAGPDPARMQFRLNGKAIKTFDIKGYRQPTTYEMTIDGKSGFKRFSAAFINDYYMPKAKNPRDRDRNLHIRYLEVQGPIDLKPELLPESHRRIITCRPDDKRSVEDCAQEILKPLARRAFRRPVTADEVNRLVKLTRFAVDEGETFEGAIQVGLQAILVSPSFLFRVELDQRPNDVKDKHSVDNFELASRLSYFLWSSMPDDELFELARQSKLTQPDVLSKQVRRMLKDPKSSALADNFAVQWLNLANLDEMQPDPEQFPTFNDKLRQSMLTETKMFFDTIVRDDLSTTTFLDARFTFLNEPLAKHYGIKGVKGDEFRRVELTDDHRIGLLTHASILTITSNPTRTSPVKRGKWILENILDDPPPPPPANVPEIEKAAASAPDASFREQLELHRRDPGCASCHRVMDELGFGFENFDAIGVWRDRDGKHPIDASGKLPGNRTFDGPVQLVAILKKRGDKFSRCLTVKLLTYALGRGLEYYDKCAIDKIVSAHKDDEYRFSTLVVEIVKSEPFLMRRGDGEKQE